MALLLIEGFDAFGTTLDAAPQPAGVLTRKHSLSTFESYTRIVSGRLSGRALKFVGNPDGYISPAPLTTNATLVLGFAFYCTSLPASATQMLSFIDGSTLGMNVMRNTDGSLSVRRGTTVLATSNPVLFINQWHYVEFKVVCNDSTGSYELRVEESPVLSASGIDTQAGSHAYHDTFRIHGVSTNPTYFVTIDDLYCLDGSGSANNDFLGNQAVRTIWPDSAGDAAQWTPSAGSNYACVDEQTVDDDTSYVESSVTNQKDLYNYESLSGVTSIAGVQVSTDCRETDAQSFSLKTPCKSGVTESDDAAQAIGTTSYVTKRRILETDPNTGIAWAQSEVNSAQFGVKVG